MRRSIAVLLMLFIAVAVVGAPAAAHSVLNQPALPGTNTPRPVQEQAGFDFVTNTPSGPTSTPLPTATPTVTATATFTPTFTVTPSATATNTPTPTPTPIGPFSYPDGINPLTGLPYPDEESMARRNLIVKVSNYPPIVRPQSGINQADVVYEYETEGGVTRFAAIFRSSAPDHVGPVRSARLIDLELLPMYQALLAYSGTSDPIQQMILSSEWVYQTMSPLKGDNCLDAGFCRFPDGDLAFEHTLYLNTQIAWALATRREVNTGYRARGFAFNETPDPNGTPVSDVFIDWYGQTDARWIYDPASGHYLRYTDGVLHYDRLDGQQLWTDNLVIIEVPHNDRPDLFEPESKTASLEIALWEQGRAYLVRDGQIYEGYWRRQNREEGSALQIIYGDNTPIMMKPGRTWVSIVRGMGDVFATDTPADMIATATQLAMTATQPPVATYVPVTPNPNS